ncbi:helix-turn-helix domain-containing protein [Anaerosporobacter sp.]|uniref:helix-turn-helix domain-containing protein n=1 Tax=Anaerosporobacter sp. TaxID=1872529 RepID=UPI00286F912A|nr:AraC family transcriptional regulator [Anaerosporobacter sp.]
MDSINNIFQVIEYMNEHIEEDLSLDDLCNVSCYTKSHLCYLFKFYIGETPNKYFFQQKLKYATSLLSESNHVIDIALKIGYNSHESFSRAFKKEFGMTPIEYRELYNKGLSKISDLNDIELTIAFSMSPSYRLFQGLDQYGKHYDVYQSLIEKGYLDKQNLEPTLEGKQLSDKYYWDCSKIIIELSKTHNTLAELYESTTKLIYIPKLLFFNFVYDLIDIGQIRNFFIGCCGSNCFTCDTLKATLTDDDELRKKESEKLKNNFNIDVDYMQINCFGCTSNNRYASCISNCPWHPCCEKHNATRCNKCKQYPCNKINDLFQHLPEFRENFAEFYDV